MPNRTRGHGERAVGDADPECRCQLFKLDLSTRLLFVYPPQT